MASHLQNTTVTNFKPGLQTSDHMPRKRKRHYNKMSLMLLIFVGCCLTLILNPLHVQAKENNNTTSKGENMLSNDHQNHQHEQDNTNIKADETNDNGIFKRLQPSDINIEMNDHEGEEQEEEEEELELEEDEHSTEVIEMIQPPHTLRHQEHYKQRMLQAEKHKQHKQQHQQQHLNKNSNDGSDNDDGVIDVEQQQQQQQQELSQYNRNLRYKQIQQVLREPIAFPTPHHRRHEQHLQHLAKQRLAKQTELTWPQQHHLRHQHHQHIQEFQPQLRHLKHEIRKQNATATKTKPQLHQRYFDRESSFMNPLTNMVTTEGPHLRHTGSNPNWKSITYANNPHNRLFSDDSHNNEQEEDIKRFSLSLHALENEKVKETLHEHTNVDGSDDGDNANYDTGDTGDNNNDDYSYEDDVDDDKEINKQNNYPSISSNIKTNVKRYTNPLKPPFSSSSSSYTFRKAHAGHHLKHTPPQNMAGFKHNLNKDNNNNNNNNEGDGDDHDDDYDDIENNKDETDSSLDESSDDDNEDDKMSDEKWNKIEHEHYRKQLQHQRAMQALRFRRTQNDNTPHTATATTITSNKYSLYSPSSISASSTYNAGWTKRQIMNDGENDNIYSRYYVPGSVTRKKEEELGSPTAILESRRQFALQQRQNKALASAHHRRIVTEGSCRLPQPRVERIRKDSWKIYTPHCTILHRCADDAGCCPNERQTCAPKRTKNVDLFFFVISLNETQGSIEKLTFVNHTECHCIDRSKQRAPEYANSAAKDLLTHNNQIPYLRRATILNCYCPNLFEKILQEDGYCRCDCSSGNMGCDWLKRGMEHFSMNDRKCIIEGRCQLPTCEYGQYIKKHGRCPRREERHLSADIDW